jgi:hypothetical protein
MLADSTRRQFLRRAAAMGGCLALEPFARPLHGATLTPAAGPGHAPLLVVAPAVSSDVNPRARDWGYIEEVLRRAGLFFDTLAPEQFDTLAAGNQAVVLLAGHLPLTTAQREALTQWVNRGGSLIGLGGTSGLDPVFGVSGARPLTEGWLRVTDNQHPLTAGLRSALHVFGGYMVKTAGATVLAEVESGLRGTRGAAILEHRFGQGRAVLLAPDLLFSIVHIQQGVPVLQDGRPAVDGVSAVNDGALKAEDGMVLDWQRDREPVAPDGAALFLEPITDELREIILRSIFHLARLQAIALPVLWYWPRGVKAVGHISHDSDGNNPQRAAALRDVMNRARIKSTWCTQFPGGYPAAFYAALQDQGFEIALHFDAMTGGPQTSWSRENFLFQHQWLLKEARLKHIASNKNHYTRWEGRLDFFRWCAALGIESDQTRGPSKKGTIGFPLGGSQPYFPLDDETPRPRFLPVLEVNMLTQDLVVVCPAGYGQQLVDSVLRHHGVAHFLFHPAHILEPKVADALCGLVDYGRSQGLEWWTCRQIHRWELLRRSVTARFASAGGFTLHAPNAVGQATLLVLRPQAAAAGLAVNGRPVASKPWTLHGFAFDALTLDLAGQTTIARTPA